MPSAHNALCELFNRFGISCLRLSKPYHDTRRPAELERSDYAVSSNIGRTISACRQAVVDIRSCMDWLESEGYEQFGVLGTSLGSCYAFIAAAMDPRLRVCAFNHASTWFGDVVWTGQSTRHIRAAFERRGLDAGPGAGDVPGDQPDVVYGSRLRRIRRSRWWCYAPYDLTFRVEFSLRCAEELRGAWAWILWRRCCRAGTIRRERLRTSTSMGGIWGRLCMRRSRSWRWNGRYD